MRCNSLDTMRWNRFIFYIYMHHVFRHHDFWFFLEIDVFDEDL